MGQNQVVAVEIAWERKKTKRETIRQQCYGRSTTNLYPANARKVGPWSRELQRVWFGVGGKQPISGILPGPLLGSALLGKYLLLKICSKSARTT